MPCNCQHRDSSAHFHREELHTRLGASRQFAVASFRLDRVGVEIPWTEVVERAAPEEAESERYSSAWLFIR